MTHDPHASNDRPEPGSAAPSTVLPIVDPVIERRLAALPWLAPRESLDRRIDETLRRRPWWHGAVAPAAAAAIALTVGFVAGILSADRGTISLPGIASPADDAARPLELVPRGSSVVPAGLGPTRTLAADDGSSVQAARTTWIRTDRFVDPHRGITVERSYPEEWLVLGRAATD